MVEDRQMLRLKESMTRYGILSPLIVRAVPDGVYEIISGHRRKYAAEQLGYRKVPVLIRKLEEEEVIIAMVDSNFYRETISPSETAELIGQQVGESKNQIRRYIRLTELIPKLLDMVDNKKLQFTVAVEISYINKEVQEWLYEYICENGFIKLKQISTLREHLKKETMNQNKMIYLLNSCIENKNVSRKVTLSEKKLKKYFPTFYSSCDMEEVIVKLLEEWKKEQEEK